MNLIPEGKLTLKLKQEVARDTLLLRFIPEEYFSFVAGQFISLKFGEKSWRAYSIASSPESESIDLLVRLVEGGLASQVFAESCVEDSFTFRGPYGHFVLPKKPDLHTIFCATGTGIAPILSMIESELQRPSPRSMEVWYGGRDAMDITGIDQLKSYLGITLKLAFSRTEDLESHEATRGRITQFVDQDIKKGSCFYICGNGDMVKSLQTALTEEGIDKKCIIKERFN